MSALKRIETLPPAQRSERSGIEDALGLSLIHHVDTAWINGENDGLTSSNSAAWKLVHRPCEPITSPRTAQFAISKEPRTCSRIAGAAKRAD